MLKKGEIGLCIFNLLYVIPFTIFYLMQKNYEFLGYIAVLVIIGLVIMFTLRRSKLDYLALWMLSIWGLLHMLGGGLMVNGHTLYGTHIVDIIQGEGQFYILKMDQVIHFYGFLTSAIVVFQLLSLGFKNIKDSKKLMIFLAWIGSMGLGALNEVVEFIAFISIEHTGVGDIYNTGLDLIFNMLGALVGAFIGFYWQRSKNERTG